MFLVLAIVLVWLAVATASAVVIGMAIRRADGEDR